MSHVREQIEHAQNCISEVVPSIDQIDLVTGLRTQPAAKVAFEEALKTPGRKYVAIVTVHRLRSINAHFGYAVGDLAIKMVLDTLRVGLSSADRIFRWSGPAFVALLERGEGLDAVRAEIRRISLKEPDKIFEFAGRSVLLPVSTSSLVLPLTSPASSLSTSIDSFIESQTHDSLAYFQ